MGKTGQFSIIMISVITGCACAHPLTNTGSGTEMLVRTAEMQVMEMGNKERLTIRGVRLTGGNAVDCPQVQADDDQTYSVSYLSPAIPIGGRIEVSGFIANVTTCRGPVLYVEEVRQLGN